MYQIMLKVWTSDKEFKGPNMGIYNFYKNQKCLSDQLFNLPKIRKILPGMFSGFLRWKGHTFTLSKKFEWDILHCSKFFWPQSYYENLLIHLKLIKNWALSISKSRIQCNSYLKLYYNIIHMHDKSPVIKSVRVWIYFRKHQISSNSKNLLIHQSLC